MTKPGRNAPAAVPYEVMPAYKAAFELFLGLKLLGRRIRRGRGALEDNARCARALEERGARILLAAAEAGARAPVWHRRVYYHYAWFGTYDLDHFLMELTLNGYVNHHGREGVDALFRMAQQALTVAAGTMAEREDRERPGTRAERRKKRR